MKYNTWTFHRRNHRTAWRNQGHYNGENEEDELWRHRVEPRNGNENCGTETGACGTEGGACGTKSGTCGTGSSRKICEKSGISFHSFQQTKLGSASLVTSHVRLHAELRKSGWFRKYLCSIATRTHEFTTLVSITKINFPFFLAKIITKFRFSPVKLHLEINDYCLVKIEIKMKMATVTAKWK